MSLTVTPPGSTVPAIRGAQAGSIAAAAPSFATDSRNSRLETTGPPDDGLRGNDLARGHINHPQRDELNDVIQSVVIEIDGMHRNLELLHGFADVGKRDTRHSPPHSGFTSAYVCKNVRTQKIHRIWESRVHVE